MKIIARFLSDSDIEIERNCEVKKMDMKKLLAGLFDFQRFEKNPALQSVIDEADVRLSGEELTDDALEALSAAGDPFTQLHDPHNKGEPH